MSSSRAAAASAVTAAAAAFLADESGSATVEWVVLSAWSVAFALAVTTAVSNGVKELAGEIETFLTSFTIKTSFDEWKALNSGAGGTPAGGSTAGTG